jgi:TonB family protein
VSEKLKRPKASDAGPKGLPTEQQALSKEFMQDNQNKKSEKQVATSQIKKLNPRAKRKLYEAYLPSMRAGSPTAGYFDFIADQSIDFGDHISINTTESKFVGFFTQMRKSIELVWIYPSEAQRRNLQGTVNLEFHVQRDGATKKVYVKESSGYQVLDKAIVNAVKLAQPFAVLPASYEKEVLIVKAAFHYVLHSSIGH